MINTLPIWISELEVAHHLSTSQTGWLSTCALAGLGIGSLLLALNPISNKYLFIGTSVIAVLASFGANQLDGLFTLFLAVSVLSTSLGVIFGVGIQSAFSSDFPLKIISIGISLGIFAAFTILFIVPATGYTVLAIMFLMSVGLVAFGLFTQRAKPVGKSQMMFEIDISFHKLLYVPFFIFMSGMWVFAAIYGNTILVTNLPLVFSIALLLSGVGALLPTSLSSSQISIVSIVSIVFAAFGGGIIFLTSNNSIFILGLVVNSIFLFTFIPIYFSRSTDGSRKRINLYGLVQYSVAFALGGVISGEIIQVWGFSAFGWIVIVSAAPAILAVVTEK